MSLPDTSPHANAADTYPVIKIDENDVNIEHEARVSKIGEAQLFYLMSRGPYDEKASKMIVSGFIEPHLVISSRL